MQHRSCIPDLECFCVPDLRAYTSDKDYDDSSEAGDAEQAQSAAVPAGSAAGDQ